MCAEKATKSIVEARAERAEAARSAVLRQIKLARELTVAEVAIGRDFKTADACRAQLRVVISISEAFSLARIMGPVKMDGTGGTYTRLLAAMAVAHEHLVNSRTGTEKSVAAALNVLSLAIGDHLKAGQSKDGGAGDGKAQPVRRFRPGRL